MKTKEELETKHSDFTIERNEEKLEVDLNNFKKEFNTDVKCYKTIQSEPLEITIKEKPISGNNTNGLTSWSHSGYKIERDIQEEEVKKNCDVKHGIKSECKVVLEKLNIEIKTEDCKEAVFPDDNKQVMPVNNEFFTPVENFNRNEMNIQIKEEEQIEEHDIQPNSEKQKHLKYNIKTSKYVPSSRKCNKIYDKIKRKYFSIMFASHSKEKVSCNLCKQTFTNNRILETHLFCHIGNKPFRCTTCNKKFLWHFLLRRHVKEHKTGNQNEISHRNLRLQPSGDGVKSSPKNGKVHVCKICGKEFNWKANLLRHKSTHSEDRPFKCGICNKGFKWKEKVNTHQKIHSEERPFKCDICNKSVKWRGSLKRHYETHSDELKYACQVCNKRFKLKDTLNNHKIIHNDKFNHICHICNKSFKRNCELKNHINNIHKAEQKYSCDICNKSFKQKSYLPQHKLIHSNNLYCDICGKRVPFGNGRLEIHKRIHKMHACKICGKEFKTNCRLLFHEATHSKDRPFKCDICNKTFKLKREVKRHQKTHTDESNYVCEVCNKRFKRKIYLEHHKLIHNDEFNHTCQVCNKSFKRSISLKRHTYVHINEYEYSCDICNKRFKTKQYLSLHKVVHSNEFDYTCQICNKSFKRSITLKQHMCKFKYSCDTCNKYFKTKYSLEEHKIIHSDKKCYVCDICGKGYTRRSALARHCRSKHENMFNKN
ncbi:zinc finger protein 708-like isoform X1 [Centruroides sculpturatus]|uniref:zinc finger protein 708-like isoform X1 n=2 Tax=Centruroides sculpturatus TaxID=218467 RepID=UPI000C6CD81A|nr:zinc finger protein 708-like isoform X1 [Centruroides sculpturatus]XP_023232618.1 zinc finger protein 708-like isoform X1 [Centruroides sculpturatus]XP_023232619.1 zinc finger protein 708-like isoform X1 [Centruroides sculpturatus]XP_023232620.1 zinc finger protein 708-like isoform X1 [Centruroides sculpturatus]XP_023232621.1 zinc finger protein 708-like isoform X1 [Centruroides sculpturatus]